MQRDTAQPTEARPVPVIGYASTSLKPQFSLPQYMAIGVLVVGALAYGLVCIPAYGRTGWPPIDRFWEATPWLWVSAVPVFTLLMPGGWSSRVALLIYALMTCVIDTWTFPFVTINPHPLLDVGLLLMNLQLTLPLHLVLAAGIALLSRLIYHWLGVSARLEMSQPPWRFRWARIVIAALCLLLAGIFPFVYRSITSAQDAAVGAKLADRDWATQTACIITNETGTYREVGAIDFVSFFDADSGLPLKQSWLRGYEPGYNAQISHLIKSRGIPAWSLKSRFISDADMVSMLTSTEMKEITSCPCNLSPNIVLFRGGGMTPWGTSIGSNSNYLDIQSRNQASENLPIGPIGEENDPAFVGQLAKYPGIYFVRCGKSVAACSADGWILQVASDNR